MPAFLSNVHEPQAPYINGSSKLELDTIEDTIKSFKLGNFIIALDSASRENEGDLIMAAEDMTTQKMAFMVRHTSGLICTPISSDVTVNLSLPQMVQKNTEADGTAYTISVDSADASMTTGISAHDRALTCRMLASPLSQPASFRRPGHVFPLRARSGGARERRGHTEATIELCRLAGKRPAGVLCELVEEGKEVDGQTEVNDVDMMRRDGCLKFGRKWGIKVCTIEDLVDYLDREDSQNAKPKTNGYH